MGRRGKLLRWWVIHSIVVAVGGVGTSRTVWIIRAIGGTLLVGVGRTLLAAVIVIGVVGMILWTTILLHTIIWTAKNLIWQSNVLHPWRIVRRLSIWRESLAFVRRKGIRGGMLR